jgi:hypothetical protein
VSVGAAGRAGGPASAALEAGPESASESPRRRQLRMWRPHLEDLPALAVPAGYRLRTYRPGDEVAWGEIMGTEGGIGREWTVAKVRERIVDRP